MPSGGGQQFTPWQKMAAFRDQLIKLQYEAMRKRKAEEKPKEEEGVIWAQPIQNIPKLTYYNNGKQNCCCKTLYDYNFSYCEGYDQLRHRDDRKHTHKYMHIDLEEEYPCRTVPLLTNSNYGHRPKLDPSCPNAKKHQIPTFYRSRGTGPCIDANGSNSVRLHPTRSFYYTAGFGYTYSPPTQ